MLRNKEAVGVQARQLDLAIKILAKDTHISTTAPCRIELILCAFAELVHSLVHPSL